MRGKEGERTDEDEVLHLRLQSPYSAPHPLHRLPPRRPDGFAIRRKKRFDLLNWGI